MPIELTMPSPTRAMIVSSVAPPTNRSRFERTVTRAFTFTPMPSWATPSMVVLAHVGAGRVDDLRVDAGADGFEHGLAGALGGEIDGAGAVEIERDAGFVRGDEREDDLVHVAAGEIMRFERIARDIDAGFDRGDAGIDDHSNRHFAQTHPEHFEQSHRRVREPRAEPKIEESENKNEKDKREEREDAEADQIERFHARTLAEGGPARKVLSRR